MSNLKSMMSVIALFTLSACGSDQPTGSADQTSTQKTIIQPQLDALEKAQQVEELLEQQQQARDKQLVD